MIIWNNKNKNDPKHDIRINGKFVLSIKSSYIQYSPLSETGLEQEIRINSVDKLMAERHHLYAHIFSKDPVRYVFWLGSSGQEPEAPPGYEWWEDWSKPKEGLVR